MSCLDISYINITRAGVHFCNCDATIWSYLCVLFWSWSSLFYFYSRLISLWSSRIVRSQLLWRILLFTSTLIWFPYGAVVLFGASCCDVSYCLLLHFPFWFSLRVYPPLVFLRLASLRVRLKHLIADLSYCNTGIHINCNSVLGTTVSVYCRNNSIKMNDFDSCIETEKAISMYKLTQQPALLEENNVRLCDG
jgi:hypothetical protein